MLVKLHEFVTFNNLACLFGALGLFRLLRWSYLPLRRQFSPLRHLPGPKNKSVLFGNMREIFASQNLVVHEKWAQEHGPTLAYRGILSSYRLFTLDTRALSFILSDSDAFPKPKNLGPGIVGLLGQGLFFAEGDVHKRQVCLPGIILANGMTQFGFTQRRIMNPAFGLLQIRELLPVFWQKSIQLKNMWLDTIKLHPDGKPVINVLPWFTRATLDMIGAAGFDYHFNSLENEDQDELSVAFKKAFQIFASDERSRGQAEASKTMRRIGEKLIGDKQAALSQELKTGATAQGRDLLTLLIKSNMAYENDGHRMSQDEVLGQISTFLVAGHETTGTSATWALYALSRHPDVQQKLRQELLESGLGDEPDTTDLDKLPYLDAVVRESLRLYPADRQGHETNSITLQKGDGILIPILALNRDRNIWGEDAMEFRPERWDSLPEAVKAMPGVWGHLMTIKSLIYTLVRAIEFDMDPKIEITTQSLSARPVVASRPKDGNQMPLICKSVSVI
ncbi:cytochrome P450 family protein [Ceratobasidium sp. AG-Ba]|nr:cytochrome P450 family protein [Ceratobasidium sp. AG-Ba]